MANNKFFAHFCTLRALASNIYAMLRQTAPPPTRKTTTLKVLGPEGFATGKNPLKINFWGLISLELQLELELELERTYVTERGSEPS